MLSNSDKARSARKAAELIRTEGWFKSVDPYIPGQISQAVRFPASPASARCFCSVTAIPVRGWFEVVCAFAEFLGYKGSVKESDIFVIIWNDAQSNPAVVIRALEAFADCMETSDVREDELV